MCAIRNIVLLQSSPEDGLSTSITMRKFFKQLGGKIIYRFFPKKPSSVYKVRNHAAFGALNSGDLVIDGGANLGLVTEILAASGAQVHAFEPNPDAFRVLASRFCNAPNVHLHQQALLDQPGRMHLYFHLNYELDPERFSQGSSLLAEKRNVCESKRVEVETVDIAEFVLSLPKPVKILKLDVEGAEYRIINRLIDTGAMERIDRMLVETHANSIPSLRPHHAALCRRIEAAGLASKIDLNWI